MDLKDAIYARRATRAFTAEPVGEGTLRDLIASAIQAPSAVNAQPWAFCVIRDKALLAKMSQQAKAHMVQNTPLGLVSHHFDQVLHDPQFDIFYHAPALIVICATSAIPWAVEDCALAAENLMLAASAAGLGTCWIGFAQGWLGTAEGKTTLGLPEAYQPVAPIIVGYPKTSAPMVPRKEPEIRWIGS